MRICGIDLKANNTIVSVIENNEEDDILVYVDMKIKKIELANDESQSDVDKYFESINSFLRSNKIEKVFIKKRTKKGNFAGGAVTFKMEAMIQLNDVCEVSVVTSQSIGVYNKKNNVELPKSLNKYQEQAYLASIVAL